LQLAIIKKKPGMAAVLLALYLCGNNSRAVVCKQEYFSVGGKIFSGNIQFISPVLFQIHKYRQRIIQFGPVDGADLKIHPLCSLGWPVPVIMGNHAEAVLPHRQGNLNKVSAGRFPHHFPVSSFPFLFFNHYFKPQGVLAPSPCQALKKIGVCSLRPEKRNRAQEKQGRQNNGLARGLGWFPQKTFFNNLHKISLFLPHTPGRHREYPG
jgi:hypothetical protein